jgi:hypothetical protein
MLSSLRWEYLGAVKYHSTRRPTNSFVGYVYVVHSCCSCRIDLGVQLRNCLHQWKARGLGWTMRRWWYFSLQRLLELTIIYSYNSYELYLRRRASFGAVFTGLHFRNISLIWFHGIWGAACAKFAIRRSGSILVPVCLARSPGHICGYSSSTIIKPRPR